MTARTWLRHPPATIRPRTCPTGEPRFATAALAAAALIHGYSATGLIAVACELCGGAHHQAAGGTGVPAKHPPASMSDRP